MILGLSRSRLMTTIGPAVFRGGLACLCMMVVALPCSSSGAADDGESFFDGLAAFDGGDVGETVRIWSALAEAGDVQANVGLGGLYLAGNGVVRDAGEAARLYRVAAEQGDSNGQLNLGRLYLTGVGIVKDEALAYVWLSLAAAQGRRWAEEKRLKIEPGLSAGQRAEAERLIGEIGGR